MLVKEQPAFIHLLQRPLWHLSDPRASPDFRPSVVPTAPEKLTSLRSQRGSGAQGQGAGLPSSNHVASWALYPFGIGASASDDI